MGSLDKESVMFFDKNFALSYMLPIALFFGATIGIMHGFGLLPNAIPLTEVRILLGILLASITLWMGGACLFMMNVTIVRLMEGYGKCNPA